jgi:non-ribosomal peptide synthetase component E (peptide arylation enzyme)
VSLLAGALVNLGVKKGDRVLVYMPMIPEAIFAMLASARIGAIHSVVFGGTSKLFNFDKYIQKRIPAQFWSLGKFTKMLVKDAGYNNKFILLGVLKWKFLDQRGRIF